MLLRNGIIWDWLREYWGYYLVGYVYLNRLKVVGNMVRKVFRLKYVKII